MIWAPEGWPRCGPGAALTPTGDEVDTSLTGDRTSRVLDKIGSRRGYPSRIVLDNDTKCTSKALDRWAYEHGVELWFIRPGKPIENCFVESFNGRFRDECLNVHWFLTLDDARRRIETWRIDYNHVRPHSSLGEQPPAEYRRGLRSQATSAPKQAAQRSLAN